MAFYDYFSKIRFEKCPEKVHCFSDFHCFFCFFSVIKIESCKTMIAEMILEVSMENIFHSLKVHFVTPVFHTCDLLYILIQPIWKKTERYLSMEKIVQIFQIH